MKKTNPIHARVLPLQGQPLPSNWREQAQNTGGNYDQRDLENMWKAPNWQAKINADNVVQSSRLSRHASWDEVLGSK